MTGGMTAVKFRRLRHSTIQIIIMSLMVLLLPVLAWLQFQWLDQLSQWEHDRIEDSLLANTTRFSEDFDRELSFLYRSFWVQLHPELELKDALWNRYANWRRQTRYPELLKNIHIYLPQGEELKGIYKFLRGSKTFLQEFWPQQLSHLEEKINNRPENKIVRGVFWESSMAPAIVAPISKLKTEDNSIILEQQHGWIILELDMNAMKKNILPTMVEQYYAQGEMAEFDIQITSSAGEELLFTNNPELEAGEEKTADAQALFFSILYRDLQMVSTMQVASNPQNEALYQNYQVPLGENYTGMLSQFDLFQRSLFLEELDVYAGDINYGRPNAEMAALWSQQLGRDQPENKTNAGLWKVTAVHKSGSLDTAINQVRDRNLAIVTGIILILGASGMVLVFSARRARRLARQQMEFVAGVTHELRTPLTIIRAAGDNLADYVIRDTEQLQKYGRMIENQGRRLSDMVEKILLYSRIQSGHQEYRFSPVSFYDVLNQALKDSQRYTEKHNILIETSVEDNLPEVMADMEALVSVVTNLLANAIKYGRSSRPVELKAWFSHDKQTNTGKIHVSVRDYGRGIPSSEQIEIFKPFYRAESVRNEQLEGSGLGLSLVKQIVEAHNGTITLESRVSQGSTFTITIPTISNSEEINEKNTSGRR
jgi:two-component system sensor histidine kinase SenX3